MSLVLLIISGFFSGMVNGFLGTGGGIILVFSLKHLCKNTEQKDIFALTLFITLFYSLLSSFFYYKGGKLSFGSASSYVLPALIGGSIGAFLLDKLKTKYVGYIFAFLCIFAGLNMTGIFGR